MEDDIKSFKTMILAGVLVVLTSAAQAAETPAPETPAANAAAEPASHQEIEPLEIEFERLTALVLQTDGNLLACDAGAKQIKAINPAGKLVTTVKLPFAPEAIDTAADGTIYCGGQGRLVMLDKEGKLLRAVEIPKKESSPDAEKKPAKSRPRRVSGIAVSDTDVFVAYGSSGSLRSRSQLFRFNLDLNNPKLLAEGLRGCCQRCDIVTAGGHVYVAENAAYRVVRYDRQGKVLDKWGGKNRKGLEGFGACCNPMNLCFDGAGVLYTSESGLGRVKRYSTDGKFLGLVGHVGVNRFESRGRLAAACSNMAIAVTPDAERVYVMDYKNNRIRVLQRK